MGVAKASPALSTTPNQVNGPIGTVLQDTATLTGSSGATGSIEFKLYATADCSGPPVDDETVPVAGDGSYATTTGYAAATAGTYQWTASYSGDADNNPAASGCGAEQVEISSFPGLYWTDGAGNIVGVPVIGVIGGAPTVLASHQEGPVGVTVNGDTVYWADNSTGTIMAVPVTGGTPTVLASGQDDPISLAANGGVVYWVDRGIHTIMEEPDGGNLPQILVNDPGAPTYLAADSGFVYWVDSLTGQVMGMRTTGGGTPFVLASGDDDAAYVTANSGTVYWTDPDVGTIWEVTVTDGVPTIPAELAGGQNGPTYMAADNDTVYWIDSGADTIMPVPAAGGTTPSVVASSPYLGASYLAAGE